MLIHKSLFYGQYLSVKGINELSDIWRNLARSNTGTVWKYYVDI